MYYFNSPVGINYIFLALAEYCVTPVDRTDHVITYAETDDFDGHYRYSGCISVEPFVRQSLSGFNNTRVGTYMTR